jgi:hypothetical protein
LIHQFVFFTNINIAAATNAKQDPVTKAHDGLQVVQIHPNSKLAGSAANPTVKLYQPNAEPRISLGAMSATQAFSTGSVRPK